jgi:FAD-dependent halogenase
LPNDTYDLVVVGGGPAGSTVATLVAKRGHRVLLLEKDVFPRHQIGESLLPATIHGICPLLGVSKEIEAANFMRKQGGTFRWGKKTEPWTFSFSMSSQIQGPTSFAFQVERSKFDDILLTNARASGVEVSQQARATELLVERGRAVGVAYVDASGQAREARSKYVADSSGHAGGFHEQFTRRVFSRNFQNIALYGYYLDGRRLQSPLEGNIFCAAFAKGWFWYIPLTASLTSVGAVVSRDFLPELQGDREAAMQRLVEECEPIKSLLAGARRVGEGQYAPLRVRKDYSYCNEQFWAPGIVFLGDAACFVDPVFSSGVHLATYSALLAARSINTCLGNGIEEHKTFNEFELRYRREFGNFYQFLLAFYDMDQQEDSYFWSARKILNSTEQSIDAFVGLVAGVGSTGEPLFMNSEEVMRDISGIATSFTDAQGADGFDQLKLDREFMAKLTRESMNLQLEGRANIRSIPLWKNGLVPSRDGLCWIHR